MTKWLSFSLHRMFSHSLSSSRLRKPLLSSGPSKTGGEADHATMISGGLFGMEIGVGFVRKLCRWLLHCKRFLVMFAVFLVRIVMCLASLCFGIASTGPDEFRERGSIRLNDLNGPRTFPECPCSWLT